MLFEEISVTYTNNTAQFDTPDITERQMYKKREERTKLTTQQ